MPKPPFSIVLLLKATIFVSFTAKAAIHVRLIAKVAIWRNSARKFVTGREGVYYLVNIMCRTAI